MIDLIDKLVIYTACFAMYFVYAGSGISVIPVIIALTVSALNSYFNRRILKLVLMGSYFLVCQFDPQFIIFTPLMCYDVFATKEQLFSLLLLIPFISNLHYYSKTLVVITVTLMMFSYILKLRSQNFNRIKSEFTIYRDNSKELSMLLKKKNSDLLEKQDYEIRVAMLNERNRIAMEIHDNVGHLLSRCLLQLGALIAINKDEQLKEGLSSIKDTMSQAMTSIRNSVHDLHDDAVDLYSQINGLVAGFSFCSINLDYDLSDNISNKLKYCFIAIVKEALSNIISHSSATEVSIALREHPALYQLIIQDNGRVSGYNPDNGIGLSNITDRVYSFNGNIHINTENGFRIFISIPKAVET